MGNMSNPTITRLGSMQLWYKHWYSDTLMPTNLQHDKMFQQLIRTYLDYGFSFKNFLFIHEYWYRGHRQKRKLKTLRTSVISRERRMYHRKFYYENSEMSVTHSYTLRTKTPEYFPARTWFVKYLRWVIICVRWYKPWKIKYKRERFPRAASGVNTLSKPTETYFYQKRLKLVVTWDRKSVV